MTTQPSEHHSKRANGAKASFEAITGSEICSQKITSDQAHSGISSYNSVSK